MKKVFLTLALLAMVSVTVVSCKDKAAEEVAPEATEVAAPVEAAPAVDASATEAAPAADASATEATK